MHRWIRFGALAALPLLSPVLGCGNSVPSVQTRTDAGATLLDGGARTADGGSSDSDAAASCADDAVRCSAGCTAFSGADCVGCGNGKVDTSLGESCDTAIATGAGPESCASSGDACRPNVLRNAGTCAATCSVTPVAACANGDGCCPSGCAAENDADCVRCRPFRRARGERRPACLTARNA